MRECRGGGHLHPDRHLHRHGVGCDHWQHHQHRQRRLERDRTRHRYRDHAGASDQPALNTTKALTANADGDVSGTVTQGDVLTFTVTVTNTGNVPLTNVVVSDSLITPTGGTTPCANVAVAGTCTLIGTYTVTALDVTTGSITNIGSGDSDETGPDTATVITPVVGSPALNTTKALTANADGDASGTVTQGDVLTFTVTVTNTGNVPLTNVVVSDSLITPTGGTTPCANVAVAGTCTLIGTYTVTALDVTTGSITNIGSGDSDETGPDTATVITPVVGSPALNTTKALTANADGDASGTVTQGDVLTFTVTVTNTGNVPLTNVVVSDSLITPTGGTTPCANVAVAGTCTLIGTYTVTALDVTTGSITNIGSGDSNETGPDTATVITPVLGSARAQHHQGPHRERRRRCLRHRDPGRCADLHRHRHQHRQCAADQCRGER